MKISLTHGDISEIPEEELSAYKKYITEKYPDEIIDEMILTFDSEGYVNIEVHKHSVPFTRIRRITGYLVGTLDRFNDAKYKEVIDRTPNDVSNAMED